MDNRKITRIIVGIIALVLLSTGFSFTVTKNAYNSEEEQNTIVETTTYITTMDSQFHKAKNE